MSNPYQSPKASATAAPSRLWRSAVVAFAVWCCFVGLAAIFGAMLSFFTGKSDELPKWNGWSYLVFSVKAGAMFGAVLSWPFAIIAFAISYLGARSKLET